MGRKNVVIVESPAKAKTIGKILGRDFEVMASMGHVRDLPERRFGVDVKKGFTPQYAVLGGRREIVERLKKSVAGAGNVFLAPDPDREGEAIAWHLRCLLEKAGKAVFHRVSYNEVTPRGIRQAFKEPRELDMKRVLAQQARRVVDRIVGYRVSPILWSRVRGASSAGRVQSVALRLVCEREKAILGFVVEEYWVLGALVRKLVAPTEPFEVHLVRAGDSKPELKTRESADALLSDLQGSSMSVTKIASREVQRRPLPPFITSALQQAMSARFGLSASATMKIAQKLYEGVDVGGETVGLITYMRTDSFSVSQDAIRACREYIGATFEPAYLPEKPNYYKSRRGAQEAHEAIRPTDVNRTPASLAQTLDAGEMKLYRAIWERFVASQMNPARLLQRSAEITAHGRSEARTAYVFKGTASDVVFAGFMKVAGMQVEKDPAAPAGALPPLTEGEAIECKEWLSKRKETKPPDRYNDGSLVRELERNGVGRPSTYAQILSTLIGRRYVSKVKRALVPTDLGMKVNDFLTEHLSDLFDVRFTAGMEEELDRIETGEVKWDAMVKGFYDRFSQWVVNARGPAADAAKVSLLLGLLDGVSSWEPESRIGKRVRDDRKFVASIKEQAETGERPISERQLAALGRMAIRYESSIPGAREIVRQQAILPDGAGDGNGPPSDATVAKLKALETVKFEDPVERRRRKYDDAKFVQSLAQRVAGGRELSEAQLHCLDRLVAKYAAQIADSKELIAQAAPVRGERDEETGRLIEAMKGVTEWRPPTERKGRQFDDRAFFKSLSDQFAARGTLSPRQKSSLQRMARAYRVAVPGAGSEEAAGGGEESQG